MNYVPQIVRKTLKENKVTLDELKYVIFHQASKIVIENLIRKLDIPLNKFIKIMIGLEILFLLPYHFVYMNYVRKNDFKR